jgi:outer membrane protein assembly factor BamB
MRRLNVVGIVWAAVGCAGLAAAETTVGWRANGLGVYPDAQPPVKWSATENIIWKTPLPGKSNASPILVGDRIFVCGEPSMLICVSAKDGAILWSSSTTYADAVPENARQQALADQARAGGLRRKLKELEAGQAEVSEALGKTPDDAALKAKLAKLEGEGKDASEALKGLALYVLPKTSEDTGYASPTPASDGKQVYAVFGTGIVACYDLEGRRRWARRLETHPSQYSEPRLYGVPESPLLAGGLLLAHLLRLTALDPFTGKTVWEAEAGVHFGSPVHVRIGTIDAVLTACGDIFRVSDGKCLARKIWPSEGLPLETCCSPIVPGDTAYLVGKGGGAVRLKPSSDGRVAAEKLWEAKTVRGWCIGSPVYADGLLYALQDSRLLVLDAGNGTPVYRQNLAIKGKTYSSMVLAGSYLYASGTEGETVVVEPGREYKEVARNTLEPFASCLVFSGTRMYVRGQRHLYCIGSDR